MQLDQIHGNCGDAAAYAAIGRSGQRKILRDRMFVPFTLPCGGPSVEYIFFICAINPAYAPSHATRRHPLRRLALFCYHQDSTWAGVAQW